MKAVDLRKMKKEELIKQKLDLHKQIAMDRFNIHMGKSNKTALLKAKRNDLARIETVITELDIIQHIQNDEIA